MKIFGASLDAWAYHTGSYSGYLGTPSDPWKLLERLTSSTSFFTAVCISYRNTVEEKFVPFFF